LIPSVEAVPDMKSVFIHESSIVDADAVIGNGIRIRHYCHVLSGARFTKRRRFLRKWRSEKSRMTSSGVDRETGVFDAVR